MKFSSDLGDLVELQPRFAPGDADLALTVHVFRDGFLGDIQTWVARHDWFAFAQALGVLEQRRTGEANLQSMSPGELKLTVKSLDRAGHLGIEGAIARREFDREIELRFSIIPFEASQLVEFTKEAWQVSEALGERGAT